MTIFNIIHRIVPRIKSNSKSKKCYNEWNLSSLGVYEKESCTCSLDVWQNTFLKKITQIISILIADITAVCNVAVFLRYRSIFRTSLVFRLSLVRRQTVEQFSGDTSLVSPIRWLIRGICTRNMVRYSCYEVRDTASVDRTSVWSNGAPRAPTSGDSFIEYRATASDYRPIRP